MSRVWKWILGILAVLVVVGLIAGAVFMWRYRLAGWSPRAMMYYGAPGAPGTQPEQNAPNDFDRLPRYHMEYWGGHMPMMGGRGWSGPYAAGPFGTGFMLVAGLFRLILPLGVLALVAYLFYHMGKRAGAAPSTRTPTGPRPDVTPLPARKVARR